MFPECTCIGCFIETACKFLPDSLKTINEFAQTMNLNISLLYEKAADHCFMLEKYHLAAELNLLSKTAHLERIANFASVGYYSQVISYINWLFALKANEMMHLDKVYFSNLAIRCFADQLYEESDIIAQNKVKKLLNTFLRENIYYDERLAIQVFIAIDKYEYAELCAAFRCNQVCLLEALIQKASNIGIEKFNNLNPIEGKEDVNLSMIKINPDHMDFFRCITSTSIIGALLIKPSLLVEYLQFLLKNLTAFDLELLKRLILSFDIRNSNVQLLANRVMPLLNTLDQTHNSTELVSKRDFYNFYVFLLLLYYHYIDPNETFNEELALISVSQTSTVLPVSSAPIFKYLSESKLIISAGSTHCCAIRQGLLYTWGQKHQGKLGIFGSEVVSETNEKPTLVDYLAKNLATQVKSVSCGTDHTLVLTDHGLYSFGSSKFGQLGIGDTSQFSQIPVLIQNLLNENIQKIDCGQYHSLALTKGGTVFSWGWGLHGQLGHGTIENVSFPKKIDSFRNLQITDISGGYSHSIALDSEGIVYTFGNGLFGQIGMGFCQKLTIPQPLLNLPKPVTLIATNYFHNVVVTENKQVYVWGAHPQTLRIKNSDKKKGLQVNQQTIEEDKRYNEHLTPYLVSTKELKNEIISKISVGGMHSLILTQSGELFGWGKGSNGQLNHGSRKEIKEPNRMAIRFKVMDVAAGFDFTLVTDDLGILWGWGQNNQGQLSNKSTSAISNEKIKVKTKQRNITLPRHLTEKELILKPTLIALPEPSNENILNLYLSEEHKNFSLSWDPSRELKETFLAEFLEAHKQELDLDSVLKRAYSFKRFQYAAFIHNLIGDYDLSLENHLKVIKYSNELSYTRQVKIVISSCLRKALYDAFQGKRTISKLFEFWMTSEVKFDLPQILLDLYQEDIKEFALGVLILQYLESNEKNFTCNVSRIFLFEIVCLTLKYLDEAECNHSLLPPVIELLLSAQEALLFPAEQMWQSILKTINQGVETLNAIN